LIKCACRNPDCQIAIHFEPPTINTLPGIWFTGKYGEETLMYVDANTIVELIRELKKILIEMTEQKEVI
jgi:hypothetical protein